MSTVQEIKATIETLSPARKCSTELPMKFTDDYKAKIRLWAAHPQVIPAPPPTVIPNFTSRKFSSHAEMNEWKRSVLLEMARNAAPR